MAASRARPRLEHGLDGIRSLLAVRTRRGASRQRASARPGCARKRAEQRWGVVVGVGDGGEVAQRRAVGSAEREPVLDGQRVEDDGLRIRVPEAPERRVGARRTPRSDRRRRRSEVAARPNPGLASALGGGVVRLACRAAPRSPWSARIHTHAFPAVETIAAVEDEANRDTRRRPRACSRRGRTPCDAPPP